MKRVRLLSFFFLMLAFRAFSFAQQVPYNGERLYQLKCGRCHQPFAPQKYTPEEWETVLKQMGPMAGLDAESYKAIRDYLFQAASPEKRKGLPTSPVLAGYLYTEYFSSKDTVDTFDLHYLNLNIAGRVHDRLSYRAEFEFEHGGGEGQPPFIEQAYLDVWLWNNTGLKIGAFLTPFNRFDEFHGPLENLMITRPQVSNEIGVSAWKEVGVDLHGYLFLGKKLYFNYDVYAINGLGDGSRLRKSRQYVDNNDAQSFGFRLSGVVADTWEAGASYYRGAWDDEGKLDLSLFGLHVLGKIKGLSLFAEYARAVSENPPLVDNGKASGFFVQVSYIIFGKLRPSVRYGRLDYLDPGYLLGRKPTNFDYRTLSLGLNWYLGQFTVFKVEYDFVREGKRLADKDNDLLALQAAIRF